MSQKQRSAERSLTELFEAWKAEHRDLDKAVEELNAWVTSPAQSLVPKFPQAIERLEQLNGVLLAHFDKEQAIGSLLAEAHGATSGAIEATQRQASKDHEVLSDRLRHLIDSLRAAEAEFDDWGTTVTEFGLFLDVLEQHEELEAESILRLIPGH